MKPTSRQHADSDNVNFDDPSVLANWASSLHVSEEILREAVREVGSGVGHVYDYVQRHRAK